MALKTSEIEKLREEYGYNEIVRKKNKTKIEILVDILNDPILIIMLVAAIISFVSNFKEGHFAETYVILALVIVNVIISYVQDIRTIQKLNALDEMNEDKATVIRDDEELVIPSRELLPGDDVKINIGIIARADLEIIQSSDLRVDESFLTGESEEVNKKVGEVIFSNSQIKNGIGLARVISIGTKTRIGQIADKVDNVEEISSQLEKKIHQLTKFLLKLSFGIAILVFILALLNGANISAGLAITISILIATVPEGLATVLTIVLTTMSTKMSQNSALIKKVALLETLGEVEYVCSDKTGTITINKMTVTESKIYGNHFEEIVKFCIDDETPTSKAIYDYSRDYTEREFKLLDSIPFSSTAKKEVKLISDSKYNYLVVYGGPDYILPDIETKLPEYKEYASKGLRTLLFAVKPVTITSLEGLSDDEILSGINAIALYGIQDPPKDSAVAAVKQLHTAGVSVVMITGDSPETARSIAKEASIITSDEDLVLTGKELNEMSDEEFRDKVEHIHVYARTQPEDKVRIVNALQAHNHIVAMTGDGTNDSIALKAANVGVAMGINGTDISKESADLILLDDNFSTIVEALKGGRQIFDNLQKFVRQMLTSNAAHTGSIIFTLLFGVLLLKTDSSLALPMTPILILWVNIISDAIPCLALGIEKPEADVLERDPIDPDAPILKRATIIEILIRGLSIGLLVYIIFNTMLSMGYETTYARSAAFIALSFGQLIHIFDARSFKTIYLKNPISNPLLLLAVSLSAILNLLLVYSPFNTIFGLQAISFKHLIIAILISSIVTFGYSLIKLAYLKYKKVI